MLHVINTANAIVLHIKTLSKPLQTSIHVGFGNHINLLSARQHTIPDLEHFFFKWRKADAQNARQAAMDKADMVLAALVSALSANLSTVLLV